MLRHPSNPNARLFSTIWGVVLAGMFAVSLLLLWFDSTTQLTPDHDTLWWASVIFALSIGAFSAWVFVRRRRDERLARRVSAGFGGLFVGTLAVGLLSVEAGKEIMGLIDFPQAGTRSFNGLLVIERAYQSYARGGTSYHIEATPIWANLKITRGDYAFMLNHRRADDPGTDPDAIASDGHFCARVTLEQSGAALRVMHAGSYELPAGTVTLCPRGSGG